MEFTVLGWPPDGPKLRLDYRQFAYAGKFVMSTTGKAVVRETAGKSEATPGSERAGSDDRDGTGANERDGNAIADFETDILAALAFNADRTDESVLWYRYITVRSDAKGQELGPRLARFVAPRAARRGYDRLKIAVNNPFAYEAMYKARFSWTGEETGIAELILDRPASVSARQTGADPDTDTYQAGLDRYRERSLGEPERSFLRERRGADPPALLSMPDPPDNPEH